MIQKFNSPSSPLRRFNKQVFKLVFSSSGEEEANGEAEVMKEKEYYTRVRPGYCLVGRYKVIKCFNLYVRKQLMRNKK